jgi:DNA polymerase-3 subunit epsilon
MIFEIDSMQQLERYKSIDPLKVACFDVETTGLSPKKDEILQISICNGRGDKLLDSYVRPVTRKRWPKAQEINGITWAMVKDCPPILDFKDTVELIVEDSELVLGYNLDFDWDMIDASGINFIPGSKAFDVMESVSSLHGRWSEKYERNLWMKLTDAAKYYRIKFEAHNSLNDVRATVKVFYAMLDDPDTIKHVKAREEWRAGREEQVYQINQRQPNEPDHNMRFTCLFVLGLMVALPLALMFSCSFR